MNFISEFHIFFSSWAFVSQLRLCSKELGNRLQTPTLIGCIFLKISLFTWLSSRFIYLFTVISEALNSSTEVFAFINILWRILIKTPSHETRRFRFTSLTMTYFHTGIRTIIGAEAFHCPVRDGKEWYHFAMVVRLNFLSPWLGQGNQFIELISFIELTNLPSLAWRQDFWMRQLGITSLKHFRASKL